MGQRCVRGILGYGDGTKIGVDGEFHRLLAERPDWTDVRKAYDDWSLAKSPTELAQAGVGLMHEIAEHSGMMLDPVVIPISRRTR